MTLFTTDKKAFSFSPLNIGRWILDVRRPALSAQKFREKLPKGLTLALCCLLLSATAATAATAGLDIVSSDTGWIVKDTTSGKTLGTFWSESGASDFGRDEPVSSVTWSADRKYVAVNGLGRYSDLTLHQVSGKTLKLVNIPGLTDEQAADIRAVEDPSSIGKEAIRWQSDGTLLIRFWAIPTVTDENEQPKEVQVFADLEVTGTKARIVGTSSEEPMASTSDSGSVEEATAETGDDASSFDPALLAGTHPCVGTQGAKYKGKVRISHSDSSLVTLEWTIGKEISRGTGIIVGNTLGVSFDNGLAIYQIIPQAEGHSLIGVWTTPKATKVSGETILVGNPDITEADVSPAKLNGTYVHLPDENSSDEVTIAGRGAGQTVQWYPEDDDSKRQALAHGESLVALTPKGFAVLALRPGKNGQTELHGKKFADGEFRPISLRLQ